MASESIYDKLQRVRGPAAGKYYRLRPRVDIEYEDKTDPKLSVKLPFVIGVIGDFAGDSAGETIPFDERKFAEINRDNFHPTVASLNPSLNLRVDDCLTDNSGKDLSVDLKFQSMDDFTPAGVARQVPELNELLKARERLNELKTLIEGSAELKQALDGILNDPAHRSALTDELRKAAPIV